MRRHFTRLGFLLLVSSALAGCWMEGTLDKDGGGTMTVKLRLPSADQFANAKKRAQSPHVTLTKASVDADKWATLDLKFADVTKLSTTQLFNRAKFSLSDDEGGTKTLSVTYTNQNQIQMPEEMVSYFGDTVTITIHLPGDVVKSNATHTEGRTVRWTSTSKEFGAKPEVSLSVTYKQPS